MKTRLSCALPVLFAVAGCDDRQAFRVPEPTTARMLDQPRADPYGPSKAFADGKVMRTPPPGTIPHDDDATIPATTISLLERGRARFDVTCAACHGIDGYGRTPVASNMRRRPPPSLHEARIRALGRAQIYDVVTGGYGLMPSYEAILSFDDRWAVADYVRALQLSRSAPIASLPPEVRARLEEPPARDR
ncbi:MAG: cytochrome c [Labilithrix sp.]|nr:cytochrome c [Labilithrix sp.]